MRAIWKGHLRFSLVTIPIHVYKATRVKGLPLHLLHRPCMSGIKYQYYCPVCERPVSNDELVKAYEYSKGKYVTIEDEELEKLKISSNKVINILYFTGKTEVSPIYFRDAYYLIPQDEPAIEAFSLLRRLLEEKEKVAIAKFTMHQREHIVCIEPLQNILSMRTLYYADEIQDTADLPYSDTRARLEAREMELASILIEHMTRPFDPKEFENGYHKALSELIEAKIGGKEVAVEREIEKRKVLNLMDALKRSIETEKVLLPKKGVVEAKVTKEKRRRRKA